VTAAAGVTVAVGEMVGVEVVGVGVTVAVVGVMVAVVVVPLRETIRLMEEIDDLIPSWPIE